jgi:hypothetical protein
MRVVVEVLSIWLALNLAIPAFILWQRSPQFRQRVFRLTLGAFMPGESKQAHVHSRH